MLGNLHRQHAVVTDDKDAVPPGGSALDGVPRPGALGKLVVDRAIAKDVDVRGVEEVREAVQLRHGLLRFVG